MKHFVLSVAVMMAIMFLVARSTRAAAGDWYSPQDPAWKSLQGTWRLVRAVNEFGEDIKSQWELYTIQGRSSWIDTNDLAITSELEIDPTKSPKWITMTYPGGKQRLGIYELKGDKLKVMMRSGSRPEDWQASGCVLWEFERVKPTTRPADGMAPGSADASRPDLRDLQGTWRLVRAEFQDASLKDKLGALTRVEGAQTVVVSQGKEHRVSFWIDARHDPKWITFIPPTGMVTNAIYELRGDKWRVLGRANYGRPTMWDERGCLLMEYERVKPTT